MLAHECHGLILLHRDMIGTMDGSFQEQQVLDTLASLGIGYTRREHPPVFTVEQAKAYEANTPGAHCKNLFLRNKKGDRHFLAVLDERLAVDLRALGQGVGAGGLSFASPERLLSILGLTPGAVGPFGLLHAGAREAKPRGSLPEYGLANVRELAGSPLHGLAELPRRGIVEFNLPAPALVF